MQAFSQQLGLASRVRFLGFQTQRQLRPLVESAELMVLSSRHEAGPFSVLEAAVVGVPTVGTCVGHIAEWAPSAAVSVGIGDWNELANSIRSLIDDEDRRVKVAQQAWQRATAEDADYTASRFQALYAELLEGRSSVR